MSHEPNKRLGQNFLTSEAAVRAMVDAAELTVTDTVLEIGPGKGILTHELLACAGHVVAIEKDAELVTLLQEKFADEIAAKKLTLIADDIRNLFSQDSRLMTHAYKVVANIPYYITGEIIEMFLSATEQPTQMVLLVQKEVAERIVARDKKESVLSIAVKAYGTPRSVKNVGRGSFSPAPNVDSAILSITDISRKRFLDTNAKRFFELVKKGFSQKRKKLSSNLKDMLSANAFEAFAHKRGLPVAARAEELSVDDWFVLSKEVRD